MINQIPRNELILLSTPALREKFHKFLHTQSAFLSLPSKGSIFQNNAQLSKLKQWAGFQNNTSKKMR